MCLAAPCRVIEILDNETAVIDANGTSREVTTQMVPEVRAGDYVMVYLGSALAIMEKEEAEAAICLYRQMNNMEMAEEITPAQEQALKGKRKK